MRIVVVRSSQPGCEPKCAEWISAEGDIVLATPNGSSSNGLRSHGAGVSERDRWRAFRFGFVVFVCWLALLVLALGVPD
jgi:hypothetical protein